MKEHICEKCEHEKECRDMVCFYELLEKEEGNIRADERAKQNEFFNFDEVIRLECEKARADERAKVLKWAMDNTDPTECYCCVGIKSCRGFAGEENCIKTKALEMLQAELTCLQRKVNPDLHCDDKCDNCILNYEKGNMGEQIALRKYLINTLLD